MENDKEKKQESDFDLFGLGGLFKGIEKLVDLAGKLEEKGEIRKEGDISFDNLKKGMKGVYGFTIKTAGGGSPRVETFGNIKKTPEGPKVDEEREPITDIFDEKDEIVIIAEMPGIEESSIKIDIKEDILEISAVNKNRSYRKEILLPSKVNIDNLKSKYNNGILEIRIKK
ncbi:MAG: Hsp20/alpha crystallin family protein [Ignavibacteriae bacterium]|jgi:HSP20 family protein|nr:Hsp20/alpha crystallin family protein [Ignavibacteriota bacterium]